MEDDDQVRRITAYHEAGHAVAALKSPGGRINEIDISFNPEVDDERGYTFSQHSDADEAFVVYAGSWAQSRVIWPTETIDLDRVLGVLRRNADDWTAFQHAMNRRVRDDDVMALKVSQDVGGMAPAEYRPSVAWHQKVAAVLTTVWPEIEFLAGHLLDGKRQIELGNGQRLVQDDVNPNRWRNPDPQQGVEWPEAGALLDHPRR